jgi:hypothetical protein
MSITQYMADCAEIATAVIGQIGAVLDITMSYAPLIALVGAAVFSIGAAYASALTYFAFKDWLNVQMDTVVQKRTEKREFDSYLDTIRKDKWELTELNDLEEPPIEYEEPSKKNDIIEI